MYRLIAAFAFTLVTLGANEAFALENPASQNCVAKGGTVRIETAGNGAQYGVCLFEDNRQCEEWALMRGECPVGGLKITGYLTPQAVYCAIRGGTYDEAAPDGDHCTLPGGSECSADALWNGKCP